MLKLGCMSLSYIDEFAANQLGLEQFSVYLTRLRGTVVCFTHTSSTSASTSPSATCVPVKARHGNSSIGS